MKYKYSFRTVAVGQEHEVLVIDLPNEISLISTFLFCDIQNYGQPFLETIEQVLYGDIEHLEFSGNVCALHITRDITTVHNNLAEDDMDVSCVIETAELRQLILLWLTEQKKRRTPKTQKRE